MRNETWPAWVIAGVAVGIFCCGGTTACNLTKLIPINPQYNAQWWKVGMSVGLAVYLAICLWWNTVRKFK